jgi:hypothetical protein
MNNLPARLRKHADEVLDPGYPYYGTPEMVREAADEIERLRLTGEEREAIEKAIGRELDAEWYGGPEPARVVTLRGLLERTK